MNEKRKKRKYESFKEIKEINEVENEILKVKDDENINKIEKEEEIEEKNEEEKTTICNVKVSFIRPKYLNLKEWISDQSNVYIGRKGVVFIDGQRYPKQDSIWCNPFKIGRDGRREEVINKYKDYILNQLEGNVEMRKELKTLKNKNLGCWCVSSQFESYPFRELVCHGQILINLLNGDQNQQQQQHEEQQQEEEEEVGEERK